MIDALLHRDHTPYREIGERAVAYVMDRAGIAYTMDEVRWLVEQIVRLRPFPEVPAALDRLRSRYRLVVLSNGDPDMLEAAKQYHGVAFEQVISVAAANSFKPHVATYTKAAEIVGVRMDEVLFIANHAFDCIGAKAAGMRTAFIDRRQRPFGATPYQPDLLVPSMAALGRYDRSMIAYLTAMAISAGIYALLALGVNLTWGMAGMVNLGLAGFFAVGAYTTALLTKAGFAIAVGVAAGAVAAAVTGAVVALITARLRADYLAIVTLGFSESVRIAAANEIWLTNGSDGISGIPGPWRGLLPPQQFNLVFLGIVVAVLVAVFVLLQRVCHSPFGRVLRAIRDDEDIAAVAGKHVLAFKVKAFAVGAAVLGVAGALYAHETSYVAPDHLCAVADVEHHPGTGRRRGRQQHGCGARCRADRGAAGGHALRGAVAGLSGAGADRGDPRIADMRVAVGDPAGICRRGSYRRRIQRAGPVRKASSPTKASTKCHECLRVSCCASLLRDIYFSQSRSSQSPYF